jgi:signal transduction histidine kinase
MWVGVLVYMTFAWVVGVVAGLTLTRARSTEERIVRVERERHELSQRAVIEERRRIARELHDVIAHSVSVMTVQTGAVRRLLTPAQEREREALLSVEQTGRQALNEMRRLVGLLKKEADDEGQLYSPQPGMGSLDSLIGTMRQAGLSVDVLAEGERRDLPPGVDLAAYRVLQEALTNALKHASPRHASVHLRWSSDQLEIEVANQGRGDGKGGNGGYGNVGMKERVALYGGQLDSGPGSDGGYVVHAMLPIGAET